MKAKSQRYLSGSIFVFLIFFSLFAFSGCNSTGVDDGNTQIDRLVLDRRIGKIESIGVDQTTARITHLLKQEDGSTILLTSAAIQLDDLKFQNKTVEVSGVLNFTTDSSKPLMNVQSIDILADTPTQEMEVVSWKNYSNEIFGWSLRYRDDFELVEGDHGVSFTRAVNSPVTQTQLISTLEKVDTPFQHVISFEVNNLDPGETLLKRLNVQSDTATDLAAAHFTKSRIGSTGIDALKKVSDDGKTIDFYFDRAGKIFHCSFHGGTDSQSLEDQNVFYDMLNSFQLTSSVSQIPSTITEENVEPSPVKSPTKIEDKSAPAKTSDKPKDVLFDTTSFNTIDPAVVSNTTSDVPPEPTLSQQLLSGFEYYSSPSYKFSFQYPKKWYFSSGTSEDSKVIKHYDFGSKPLEEEPGVIGLDILTGGLPAGETIQVNGVSLVKVTSDDLVQYYVKGNKSRVYRLTGPINSSSALSSVASTIQD